MTTEQTETSSVPEMEKLLLQYWRSLSEVHQRYVIDYANFLTQHYGPTPNAVEAKDETAESRDQE